MPENVDAMRRDAVRRAQETQRRAQMPPPGYSGSSFTNAAPSPQRQGQNASPSQPSARREPQNAHAQNGHVQNGHMPQQNHPPQHPSQNAAQNHAQQNHPPAPNAAAQTLTESAPAPSFFDTLFADRERNLLLGILLLLLEEKDTDPGALLAMLYLLL